MRISFDLDDTLICNRDCAERTLRERVPYELNRIPFFLKPWLNEPLRLGTPKLMKKLERYGCEILIYTTSFRSPFLVRLRYL